MSVASELTERLRRHYIKQPQPGGVFVAECGLNNNFGAQRRVDAVHVGFTGTSGQILRGHEVKVSRADWLHELDQPDKASIWQEACHEWYLVTPTPEIVKLGELPPGWGHMVPDLRTAVRFKILVKADRKPADHSPSWLVMRSILARMETLERADRAEEKMLLAQKIREEVAAQYEARQAVGLSSAVQAKVDAYDELAKHLGLNPKDWSAHRHLMLAAKLAPAYQEIVGFGGDNLRFTAERFQRAAQDLLDFNDRLTAAIEGATQ